MHQIILLRRLRFYLRLPSLSRLRIGLLPHLHQCHQFLEYSCGENPPRRLFVASREIIAHPPNEIAGIESSGRLEGSDDIDGWIPRPSGTGDTAGEIDESGSIARIRDHDDFEGFGAEVAGLYIYGLLMVGLCKGGARRYRLAHRVAMTPWTCAALWIRRTANLPSLLNLGGVCVWISTSLLIAARASSSLALVRMSFGLSASSNASQAEITSKLAVLLAGCFDQSGVGFEGERWEAYER